MKYRKLFFAGALALTALATVPLVTGAGLDCPPIEAFRDYRPPEATQVFAADGTLITSLSPQRRTVVTLDEVSPLLRDGVVAVEDRRFWSHGGVDLRGVARALWRDVTSLSLREGFSTIPMQLVRNVFPEQLPRTEKLGRKACEVRMAGQIEREFDKEQILALYLNQIYMGNGLYGMEAAAQGYFGKSAAEVDVAEAALLIGILQSPEGHNPRRHPLRAVQRRNVVLDVMAREGVVSPEAAEAAKAEPLHLVAPPESSGSAPWVVAAVRRELHRQVGPDADILGLNVYTGIDLDLQHAAREALLEQIRRVEDGGYGRYRHPRPGDEDPPAPDADGSPFLQGTVVALDLETGAIRALVGGRDFALSQFDRAFQARRQPGSAFKPLVYAAALERRLPVTTRVETSPVVVEDAGQPVWQPGDHVDDTVESLTIREALAISSNNAAVRIGQWVGVAGVADIAARLGLSTPVPPYPSVFLGAAEVVPAELVAAFAAFGNGGYAVEPHLITRIEDRDGRVLWRAPRERRRAIDEGTAFLTLSILRDAVDTGTGRAVRAAGYHHAAAGKTGTTNDSRDTWFIGLTPDFVAGVWLGFDRPATILPNASGGSLAAPVWGRLMARAYEDRPAPRAWNAPATVVSAVIDTESGALATGNCPEDHTAVEYFLPGTAPVQSCPLHPESGIERMLDRVWRSLRRIF